MCTQLDFKMPIGISEPAIYQGEINEKKLDTNKKYLIRLMAKILEDLIIYEKKIFQKSEYKRFDLDFEVNLSLYQYLMRIESYLNCQEEIYILSLIYIDKILAEKKFFINRYNVYSLLICSILIATKFFYDDMYNNAVFAIVGGLPNSEINQLEEEFLIAVHYELFIDENSFKNYRKRFFDYFFENQENQEKKNYT